MEIKSVVKGNTVEAHLITKDKRAGTFFNQNSPEIFINRAVVFQVKVTTGFTGLRRVNGRTDNILFYIVFVRFRSCVNDNVTYVIKVTSKELGIKDKCFTSDDGTWHLLVENNDTIFDITNKGFDVVANMEIVRSASPFASLTEDTKLTDFVLCCEDGSVHVHRAVLAAASPELRRMLGGAWRHNTEARVDVPDTSRVTLQYFKNYMYMHLLPDDELEQLLLLAIQYKMADLEQKCVDKLVRSVTAENACDMIEFAVKHEVTGLLLAVLERVQSGAVSVTDMRKCLTQASDSHNSNWAHLPFFQSPDLLHAQPRIEKAKAYRRRYKRFCEKTAAVPGH